MERGGTRKLPQRWPRTSDHPDSTSEVLRLQECAPTDCYLHEIGTWTQGFLHAWHAYFQLSPRLILNCLWGDISTHFILFCKMVFDNCCNQLISIYNINDIFLNDSDKKKHVVTHDMKIILCFNLLIFCFSHTQLSFSYRGRTHRLPNERNPCPSWQKFQLNFITTSRLYIFTGQCKSPLMPGNALYGPPLSQSISFHEDLFYISK